MKVAQIIVGSVLFMFAVLTVVAGIDSMRAKAGPKVVPNCQDNAALRVLVQKTGQPWVMCFLGDHIVAVPESRIGELP